MLGDTPRVTINSRTLPTYDATQDWDMFLVDEQKLKCHNQFLEKKNKITKTVLQ